MNKIRDAIKELLKSTDKQIKKIPRIDMEILEEDINNPIINQNTNKPDNTTPKEKEMSYTIDSLKKTDGLIAAALVDSSSGMMLESLVLGNFPVEIAAAANTAVIQAKLKAMDAIDLEDDKIEDILITLGTQYHLIRPLNANREIFIYIALDRDRANLAMARIELRRLETSIKRM